MFSQKLTNNIARFKIIYMKKLAVLFLVSMFTLGIISCNDDEETNKGEEFVTTGEVWNLKTVVVTMFIVNSGSEVDQNYVATEC